MISLQNPISILRICDCVTAPCNLEMPWCFFEEGGPREGLDVEFGFWGHLYINYGGGGLFILVCRVMVRKGED